MVRAPAPREQICCLDDRNLADLRGAPVPVVTCNNGPDTAGNRRRWLSDICGYAGHQADPPGKAAQTEWLFPRYGAHAISATGLAGWFLPKSRAGIRFTNYRRDDDTVFIAVAFLVCFEAIPVHFLVHHYSVWAAWVLTVLSAYTLLWIVGEMSARRHRPTLLASHWLRVNHGLRGEAVIKLAHILIVEAAGEQDAEASVGRKGQLLFRLAEPTTVFGLFGKETQANTIRVAVDEPERLAVHLRDCGVSVEEAL